MANQQHGCLRKLTTVQVLAWFSTAKKWHRANDKLGIAYAISGLSRQHQDYLKAGGLGFALGDGILNYTDERMLEAYYLYTIVPQHISLSGFYQLASNPDYNRDRKGPVDIFFTIACSDVNYKNSPCKTKVLHGLYN